MPPLLKKSDEDIRSELLRDYDAADHYRQYFEEHDWKPSLKEYFIYKDPVEAEKLKRRGRANMVIAKAYEQVETKLPRWVMTTFAQDPIVQALPSAKGHEQFCDQNTKLVNSQLQKGEFPVRAIPVLKEAIILGTAVVMVPWHEDRVPIRKKVSLTEAFAQTQATTKEQEKMLRKAINAARGETGQKPLKDTDKLPDPSTIPHITDQLETEIRIPETLWEGPVSTHIDLFDFWVDPKTTNHMFDNCRFVIRRFYRTTEELEAENERREEQGLEPIYINLKVLKELGPQSSQWHVDSGQATRFSTLGIPLDRVKSDGHEMLEFWYDDGSVFTLANKQTLVRKGENPFANPKLSSLFHTLVHEPQPFRFYGTGLIQWIRDQLEGYKSIWNSTLDNVNLVVGPPIVANLDKLVNPNDITSGLRPNQLIAIDVLNGNETIQGTFDTVKFPSDMVSAGWSQLDRYDASMESTTGLYASMKGAPSAPRTPFSSEATRLDEGNVRIRLNLMLIGEWMSGIAEAYHWRNYQFLPPEYPMTLFGKDGQAYVEHVQSEQVRQFLHYRFVGGSLEPLANKQVQAQNFNNLLAVLAGVMQHDPSLRSMINWPALLRSGLSKFDFLPPESIVRDLAPAEELAMMLQSPAIMQDPQVQQMLMQVAQQMMAQQQGMQPGMEQAGMPQSGAPPPNAPSPEQPAPQPGAVSLSQEQDFEEASFENRRLIKGLSVDVDPNDDHFAHLQTHAMALQEAQAQAQTEPDNPTWQGALAILQQHISEHQQYLQQSQGGMA